MGLDALKEECKVYSYDNGLCVCVCETILFPWCEALQTYTVQTTNVVSGFRISEAD